MLRLASSVWPLSGVSVRQPARRWRHQAVEIDRAARELETVSAEELLSQATALRYRSRSGESLDDLLVSAFSLVVEAARRTIGLRHYQVQIVCGIALHHGCIAEMQTGEGKTLVATLPLFLNALPGQPVHLATANDYLAQRDADTLRPVYAALGLTVGAVTGELSPAERRHAYDCDITYGTAREFGFDFLRDRLTLAGAGQSEMPLFARTLSGRTGAVFPESVDDQRTARYERHIDSRPTVQRLPYAFALIDEADSLLIDEARTPLIVSGPDDDPAGHEALFHWAATAAGKLHHGEHLEHEFETGRVDLTPSGYRLVRALQKPAVLAETPISEIIEAVVRAAYVEKSLQRDRHYVVRDGEVQIVDEYTGRIADGRRWRNGVHQAVEAREGVSISPSTQHCARITVQELFGLYERCSGMTGTAASASREFAAVYCLPVVAIPPRRPNRRETWSARVFLTSQERWDAIVREVAEIHTQGRPVLIGTRTIEQSDLLSERLSLAGLAHEVLNARNHEREAEIVAQAGQAGRITVATNMAGRGTDIELDEVAERAGGLHVICSELHASARIDRQLIGRCARQGDPGSYRQFLSLEDEILRQGLGDEAVRRLQQVSVHNQPAVIREALRAQKLLERRHEEDRRLLLLHSRERTLQLIQLGQDPYLDAV
jgi:preprotein translocase subunit SecA